MAKANLPELFAWAKANRQGQFQETVQRQMLTHDVSGFKALADQWFASVAPSVAALRAAGVPVRTQGRGVQIQVRGQWMTPGAAAKAGLI